MLVRRKIVFHIASLLGPVMSYSGDRCPGSDGATAKQIEIVLLIEFLLEAVGQSAVGFFGILCNILAMLLLATSKRLNSVFNKTLFFLLLIHTLFIVDSLMLELYKVYKGFIFNVIYTKVRREKVKCHIFMHMPFFHTYPQVIYPLKPTFHYTSTFLTVLMARERFQAVRHPVEYRNAVVGTSLWRKAVVQTVASFTASLVFIIPLFFESEIKDVEFRAVQKYNETHSFDVSTPINERLEGFIICCKLCKMH